MAVVMKLRMMVTLVNYISCMSLYNTPDSIVPVQNAESSTKTPIMYNDVEEADLSGM